MTLIAGLFFSFLGGNNIQYNATALNTQLTHIVGFIRLVMMLLLLFPSARVCVLNVFQHSV